MINFSMAFCPCARPHVHAVSPNPPVFEAEAATSPSDYADDPTEDTESESDTQEVKIVDGKIVVVSDTEDDTQLIAVPDTDDDEEVLSEVGPAAMFDEDGNIIDHLLGPVAIYDNDGNPIEHMVGPVALFDKDGNIIEQEDDLCSSEGINYPENDVDQPEATSPSDYADDPTEDTESESDTQEVKIVDGKIVVVSDTEDDAELIAVVDTDDDTELIAVVDTDDDTELIAVPDTEVDDEVITEVGPSAMFDEDGNVVEAEDDLCSSEGINYPENDTASEE
ncbi:hypothetical protein D6853_03655 [Butyrivibrio sp. X503]|nr:hypothetical protein D6853_03655 [Butyrivibrio sp. X503]